MVIISLYSLSLSHLQWLVREGKKRMADRNEGRRKKSELLSHPSIRVYLPASNKPSAQKNFFFPHNWQQINQSEFPDDRKSSRSSPSTTKNRNNPATQAEYSPFYRHSLQKTSRPRLLPISTPKPQPKPNQTKPNQTKKATSLGSFLVHPGPGFEPYMHGPFAPTSTSSSFLFLFI